MSKAADTPPSPGYVMLSTPKHLAKLHEQAGCFGLPQLTMFENHARLFRMQPMNQLPFPLTAVLLWMLLAQIAHAVNAPAPYGPVPSERQLHWHAMEMYGFCHFTVNTFTDREWGHGDEAESVFNPTDFDADQIARTFKEAGMKGLILTAKHHDGFCLWPSKFTEHSVKNSPWRGGKGDVVKELSEACKRAGIEFGIYLSPWDRNQKDYGRPEYVTYYRNQLRELMTNYGDLFVWFDGANGGDGYYGGARETRKIDNRTYYGWPETWKLVRELQPNACMFSDGGPDMRWVGNENGVAGDPCWATMDTTRGNRYPRRQQRKSRQR
jgi:alpha-L-fucosidase